MKPGDDVLIVKSEEKYHVGVEARVLESTASQVRLWFPLTGKTVTYSRANCELRVVRTEEERHASYRPERTAKAVHEGP